MGSRLHTLRGAESPQLNRTALSYASEALAPMEDVVAESATCRWTAPDVLEIQIRVVLDHTPLLLEVKTQ